MIDFSCQNPEPENQRMQIASDSALYLCVIFTIVGLVVLVKTHRGKSALSYLPNRFTGGQWNERTVSRLLQRQREWAFQLGLKHTREQQRQRKRRNMMESSSSPQTGVGYPPAGVEVVADTEEEELKLWVEG